MIWRAEHYSGTRPRLLDLFCKAGGAGKGYDQAGFDVVGIDKEPQPNYPFAFMQSDAIEILTDLVNGRTRLWPSADAPNLPVASLTLRDFAAIHASPPCQANSSLRSLWKDREHEDLIEPTRELLEQTGLPYVIENVPGAALRDPLVLCGSMFGLGANGRQLRRHRLFESNVFVMRPSCQHRGQPVGVYGHGGGGSMTRGYKGTKAEYVEAMQMPWATKAEIAQAIPPAYTKHIGAYLMAEVQRRAEVAA